MLQCDGFEAAFLGVIERCGQPPIACYSYDGMVAVLMERDGMERDEAEEYLQFNVLGAWVGDETPAILRQMTMDEAQYEAEREEL
jgi:hypothetical protein